MRTHLSDYLLFKVSLFVSVAIVLGTIILVALEKARPSHVSSEPPKSDVRKIGENDHILGSVNAEIALIVYTDLECKYCKRFYDITQPALFQEYGDSIAIVHRHYPLPSRPKAKIESEASECAAILGGEDAFWRFIDRVYAVTPSDNGLDLALLPEIAEEIGLDREAFIACQADDETKARIVQDIIDGTVAGVRQTPSILVQGKERSILVTGDYPQRIRTAIEYVRSMDSSSQ